MSVTLRLYDGAGSFLTMLPLVGSVDVQHVLNDEGAGTLQYTASGQGAQQLMSLTDGMIAVHLDGAEVFRFLVEEDQDDEADDAGLARDLTIGGPGTLAVLARGIVLPEDGIGAIPAIHKFVNATPGKIMLTLLGKMKAKGYLPQVTTSFTETRDSAGQLWDSWVDIEYDAGKDLLVVVKDLAAQGACDVQMTGLRLDLFNPNTTLGQDKPGIFIRRAHAESAPRKRSRRNLRTDFLVVGDEGVNTLRFDQDARDKYGKRIGFVGQGNTLTADALYRVGDEALKENARPSRGYQMQLRLEAPSCPVPYLDFDLGDAIRSDFAMREEDGGYEPLRVRAIATTFGRDGATKVSLEMNDRFTEAILDLARKVDGIRHGKVSGSSAPPSAPTRPDVTIPSPPATLITRTQLSYSPEGNATATVRVSWPPVRTNADDASSPLTDLQHYEVRYMLPDQQIVDAAPEEWEVEPPPEPEPEPDPEVDEPWPEDPEPEPDPGEEPVPPAEWELQPTFAEEFARPNSQLIGNGWQQVGGDFNLRDEAAVTSSGGTALLRNYGRRNLEVEATLTADSGTPGVLAWADPTTGISSGYFAQFNVTAVGTNVTLRRNGVQVAATHFGPANNYLGPGTHSITMQLRDNVITVLVNGEQALQWTETGAAPSGAWLGAASGLAATTGIDSVRVSEWVEPVPFGAMMFGVGEDEVTTTEEVVEELDPAYTYAGTTTDTTILLTGLPTKTRIQVEVRAVDTSNNKSDWAIAAMILTAGDDAEPPPPAAPTLTPILGGIEVRWARQDDGGGSVPPDFDEVEVHASLEGPFFEPSSLTLRGHMVGTTKFVSGLTYGLTWWFRLVMIDRVGNRSQPSVAMSAVPGPLVSAEIGVAQITRDQLDKQSVSVEKLTVGVLNDQVLLNADFEELTDSGVPALWNYLNAGAWRGSYAIETNLPKSGSQCIRMRADSGWMAGVVTGVPYPVTAGQWYYCHAHFKGSAGQGYTVLGWLDGNKQYLKHDTGAVVTLSGAWQKSVVVGEAPDGARYCYVELNATQASAGTDVWVDAVDLRMATGEAQILNASITSAKIFKAAVQDIHIGEAQIGTAHVRELNVDRLTAGELRASYVTVTGRLTSKAGGGQWGNRWELDADSFRAYDGAGTLKVRIGGDGNAYFSGTIGAGADITGATVSGGTITSSTFRTRHPWEGNRRVEISGGADFITWHQDQAVAQAPFIKGDQGGGQTQLAMYSGHNGDPNRMGWFVVNSSNWGTDDGYYSVRGGGAELLGNQGYASYHAYNGHHFNGGSGVWCNLPLYEYGQRVYSPNNPPPAQNFAHDHDYTNRHLGQGYLYDSPLWIRGHSDWNHQLGYNGGWDGPELRGYSNVIITTVWNSFSSPVALADSAGRWRMNAMYVGGAPKSFVIDHPTDPDRYLVHAAIEGPTADVFYRGEATLMPYDGPQMTDQWGHERHMPARAVITLPDYFEALTKTEGRTVTVTPIIGCEHQQCSNLTAPTLAVTRVKNGKFEVVGQAGFMHGCASFFWEVKAVREDVTMEVEPQRSDYVLHGDGPYTYLQPAA